MECAHSGGRIQRQVGPASLSDLGQRRSHRARARRPSPRRRYAKIASPMLLSAARVARIKQVIVTHWFVANFEHPFNR